MLILVLNWDVARQLVTLHWNGQFTLIRLQAPPGGSGYLPEYLTFMTILCVFPYLEENIRCLRHSQVARQPKG
jgi:hypothetical protein